MDTMKKILDRMNGQIWDRSLVEYNVMSWFEKNKMDADELLTALDPGDKPGTWYWPDIDYTDQTRSEWKAGLHYSRMLYILYEKGRAAVVEDMGCAQKLAGALKYWLAHDFRNPNWWHNEIGAPGSIADLTMMLMPVLDSEDIAKAVEIVSRGSFSAHPEYMKERTGANLIWDAGTTIKYALLTQERKWIPLAVEAAASEIVLGKPEGPQEDGSFFQHGPRLYSGGYGRVYACELARIAHLVQGTEFQFSPDKMDILLSNILDGTRYMTQGGALDFSCLGREIVRENALDAGILYSAVRLLSRIDGIPRQDELVQFLASMDGGEPLNKTKYFPKAALLCCHTGGIYVGAKFHNNQIFDAEICNSEGELCYNMSYGTHTCIMKDGTEYMNIHPVWDMARIPGTTGRTETDEELLAHRDWWRLPLPNAHSGGLQKGERAVIYEKAEHDGVEAIVTDFAFEGGFVSLGAGVRTISRDNEALVTTVDQCRLQGEVTQQDNYVEHHGIRYTGLDETRLECKAGEATGSWKRDNFAASDAPVAMPVLTLTVSHPAGKTSSYAYMISPAGTAPQVEVLRNDCGVQAIRLPDGKIMAAFHTATGLVFRSRTIQGDVGGYIE